MKILSFNKDRFCSAKQDYVVKKSRYFYRIYNRFYDSPTLQALLANPDSRMFEHLLKYAKFDTTTVSLVTLGNLRIVIKRYNIKGFWHGLKRAISKSRAIKCWYNAHRLIAKGIFTPKPIAVIEKRWGPIRREAYFLYEYLEGTLLGDYLQKETLTVQQRQECVDKFLAMVRSMISHKISHGDLKHTNFLICNNEVYCIDLDGMRFFIKSKSYEKAKQKDMRRFLQNWDNNTVLHKLFSEKLINL